MRTRHKRPKVHVNFRTEYEAGVTTEAKLCKDFDKIEMIMQAYEYEAEQSLDLQEFFDSTAGKWRTPLGYIIFFPSPDNAEICLEPF